MGREHLEMLSDRAAAAGVDLDVALEDDHLWLGWIERFGSRRSAGSAVLEDLVELADDLDLPLRCAVDVSSSRLVDWYLEHGFEIESFDDLAHGRPGHAILVRHPDQAPLGVRRHQLQEA